MGFLKGWFSTSSVLFVALFSSVIAQATPQTSEFLLKVLPTGRQPKGAEVSINGQYVFVANMDGTKGEDGQRRASIDVYDLEKIEHVKTIYTPNGPSKTMLGNTEILFTRDGRYGLVTRFEGGPDGQVLQNKSLVNVIDMNTLELTGYIPSGGEGSKIMAERPPLQGESDDIVYVSNWFFDNLGVINLTKYRQALSQDPQMRLVPEAFVEPVILTTRYPNKATPWRIGPRGIAFTPDGQYALIMGYENGGLIIVDARKHTQIGELPPYRGGQINLRHIIMSQDGSVAYLSHMRGNAVSRLDVPKLMQRILEKRAANPGEKSVALDPSIWDELFIPWQLADGTTTPLWKLEDYPLDHPLFPGKSFNRAHPNTIVLDPIENRYLFVSHRTTGSLDKDIIKDERGRKLERDLIGKIDILDMQEGRIVMSLVGGVSPTALAISHNGRTLVSSGYRDNKLYFYDVGRILDLYRQGQLN